MQSVVGDPSYEVLTILCCSDLRDAAEDRQDSVPRKRATLPSRPALRRIPEDGGGVATCRSADSDYCVAETKIGVAVLLQPFISILPSGRAVPVIMPVVLKGVATLP